MFQASLVRQLKSEIAELKSDVKQLERKVREGESTIRDQKREISYQNQEKEIAVRDAVSLLRKEMQKSLVDSDLARNAAQAKLDVYLSMDTKADQKVIKDMIGQLISKIGAGPGNTISVVK